MFILLTDLLHCSESLSSLLDALLERIWDKEVSVRAQAAIALTSIMQRDIPTEGTDIMDTLLETLKFDEAPCVYCAYAYVPN